MKNGFTLVELSIVLVIIGLLTGGILVAQSMIESAKIIDEISKLQQYQVAVTNFKTKFNQLPGDSPNFDPPGNGNGVFDNNGTTCNAINISVSSSETINLWAQLSQAEMIKRTYTGYSPASCGGTDDGYYYNVAGKVTPIFNVTPLFTHSGGINTNKVSIYYYYSSAGYYFRSYVPSMHALALDAKLDDNVNTTGKLITLYSPGPGDCRTGIAAVGASNALCRIDYYPD